jgi:diadenosine tetraphosphate (Ap4A) HIT family hydrolase
VFGLRQEKLSIQRLLTHVDIEVAGWFSENRANLLFLFPVNETLCAFCEPDPERVFYSGEHVRGLWDAFPVSAGHALLIPKRHVAGWFDARPEEQAELMSAIRVARAAIETRHRPDGYNIGINVGAAGIYDQHLAELVIALRNDDCLALAEEEHEQREPQFICSIGLHQP